MRRRYETGADRDRELKAVRAFVAAFDAGSRPVKMTGQYDRTDFAVVDQDKTIVSWCEVKCRNNAHDAYPTYMLSLAKWLYARSMSRDTGLPYYLIINFSDGIFYLRVKKIDVEIKLGGRMDRGDAQDIEPVVHIPMDLFKPLRRR